MNLATNLERSAFYFPDRPALSEGNIEISYAEINTRANTIASALVEIGLKPGEMVGLFAPNSSDWIAFYFGVLKTGAVAVTLSSVLTRAELELLVYHAKPKILFTTDEKLDDLTELRKEEWLETVIGPHGDMDLKNMLERGDNVFETVDRDCSDAAVILYTGGTTGIPKGVMLTHENVNAAIQNVRFHERSLETDRALLFLPLNHVFGQMHIMNATLLSAGCLEMIPSFDLEQVLHLTSTNRVTRFYAVPTIYVRLLTTPDLKKKLGNLRYCFSAASSMPEEVVRQWKEQTGLSIYESYGMTESASMSTYNHYYRHVVGSVGTPVPGVEIQIRDENGKLKPPEETGEICLKGRNIMKGYFNNPEATETAFWDGRWFRSGDVGRINEEGYLFIVDRIKDMIITGGENVYPREVEEVLFECPQVAECSVIGMPDPEYGEKAVAVCAPAPGERIEAEVLRALLKRKLSGFKVPKEFIVWADLPKSPAGKILKREIKKQLAEKTFSQNIHQGKG